MNVICKFLVVKPIVETWSKGKYLQLSTNCIGIKIYLKLPYFRPTKYLPCLITQESFLRYKLTS